MQETVSATGMHQQSEAGAQPSERVVDAVADAEGVEPWELTTPLYEVVDPDALDELFRQSRTATDAAGPSVTFSYCGYSVTVTGDDVAVAER